MPALALQQTSGLDARATAIAAHRVNDHLVSHATIPNETVQAVRRLADEILANDIEDWLAVDPQHALRVHRAVIEAQEATSTPDDRDSRNQLRLALGQITSELLAIAEAEPVGESRSSKQITQWLVDTIEVPQRDIARLLGVDLRKLQRWISDSTTNQPEGDDALRVRTIARVVNQLRHTLTAPGVIEWFDWASPDLNGETPADVLKVASRAPEVLRAAANMRSTTLA